MLVLEFSQNDVGLGVEPGHEIIRPDVHLFIQIVELPGLQPRPFIRSAFLPWAAATGILLGLANVLILVLKWI